MYLRPELEWAGPALQAGLSQLCADLHALGVRLAAAAALAQQPAGAAGQLVQSFEQSACALLLSTGRTPLHHLLALYYAQRLHAFAALRSDGDGEDAVDGDAEMGGAEESDEQLTQVSAQLTQLGLAALVEEAVARCCAAALKARLENSARGAFDSPVLPRARRWLGATLQPFVGQLLPPLRRSCAAGAWRARLEHALHAALGALRTEELFDIIVDYPDTRPALADLSACLAHTTLATSLGTAFRGALRRRLLHAGAATPDILAQYVNTVKALRELDPGGAILESVSQPLRAYLRGRRDTIRCVVTLLTEAADGGDSLIEELAREEPGGASCDSDLDGDAAPGAGWESWSPAATQCEEGGGAGAGGAGGAGAHGSAQSDVVSLLVALFGSRELFVAEYRALLAERLLGQGGFECERDVRTLELLKLRFGDAVLHQAEVMLKDVADSKRIDGNVRAQPQAAWALRGVGATVISQLFWPPFAADASADVTLPRSVQAALDVYGERFEALKAPRKLQWKKGLGSVTLRLALGGLPPRDFTVSPAHATLMCAFHRRDVWAQQELAAATGLALPQLRAKMAFWLKAGVLTEAPGPGGALLYAVAESLGDAPSAALQGGDEPPPGAVASAEEQADAEMVVYEQYVMGMLTNFDSLPLERIHNMLKMFVSDPPYDKTAQQLDKFLARLVAEEKLSCDGGAYRRVRRA